MMGDVLARAPHRVVLAQDARRPGQRSTLDLRLATWPEDVPATGGMDYRPTASLNNLFKGAGQDH